MGQRLYKTEWLDPLWPLKTDADAARKCYCDCKTLENLISEQANQRSVSKTLFDRWLKTDVAMPRCWERWNNCSRVPQRGARQCPQLVGGWCLRSLIFFCNGWTALCGTTIPCDNADIPSQQERGFMAVDADGCRNLFGRFNYGTLGSQIQRSSKLMALTLGVIHAVGAGMVFIIAPTIISEHFVKNKGLAMGLNFTGVTLGLFVFPKLLEFLNASYGLHGALLIFGAVCLNGLAFSLFLRTPSWRDISPSNNQLDPEIPAQSNDQPQSPKLRHAMTVFKEPVFYLIMYSFNTYCLGYECYVSLFVDFACDKGVMVSTAVTVMAAGAVFEVLGRLTLPAVIDRGLLQIKTAVLLTLVLGAVTFLILPFVNSHDLIFTLAFVIAFTIGTGMVIFSMTLASYFGHEKMSVSFGIVVASAGMFSFVKPYLIGHFRDKISLVSCITPLPNLDTILQHLAMFCGALNNCSSVLHSESMQVVWPCWKDVAREGFGRTRVLSPYQVSCIEKLGECANKKLTSIRSSKLMVNELMKLAGFVPQFSKSRRKHRRVTSAFNRMLKSLKKT
ncbi:hypothetical protein MRX96_008562 [Rhipicephalus microplus]